MLLIIGTAIPNNRTIKEYLENQNRIKLLNSNKQNYLYTTIYSL